MKNMEKYELKTGAGITDVIPMKDFDKNWIVEEITSVGFYSDFHPFREAIKAYPDDCQVLIVADEGEKYGNNWLLCVTPAAREEQLKVVADREAAKKAQDYARRVLLKLKAESDDEGDDFAA